MSSDSHVFLFKHTAIGESAGTKVAHDTEAVYLTMKRLFAFLFATMLVGQVWAQTTFTIGNLKYTVFDAKKHYVSVVKSSANIEGDIVIPATIENEGITYIVKRIGNSAFSYCNSLKSVIIGDSVTLIGEEAFIYCTNMESISIPNSIMTIGRSSFGGCNSLTAINIPNSVLSIDNYAFCDCYGLMSVNIPNSVTYIGQNAFQNCTSLTSIVIPNSVTSILGNVFSGCKKLSSVIIPSTVTDINSSAFSGCDNLSSIILESDIDFKSTYTLCFTNNNIRYRLINKKEVEVIPSTYSGNVIIPETVIAGNTYEITSIGDRSFQKCVDLESINIGKSVKRIGNYAFLGCKKLSNIIIPNSVVSIGESVFMQCENLKSIVIPDSVISIGAYAFDFCNNLTDVTIGNSVTSIGSNAFENCSSMTSLIIGNSVTDINSSAFRNCSSLTSVVIPNTVTTIGEGAFSDCSNLTSLSIGSSVLTIGFRAFSECNNLSKVIIHSTVPPVISQDIFPILEIIYVPAESVESYKSTEIWKLKKITPFAIVSVSSSDSASGVVLSDSLMFGNEPLTISAIPSEGFHFVKWSDGNDENPRIYSTSKDTSFTAIFEKHIIIVDSVVLATCSAIGLTEGSYCSVCGKVIVAQSEIPMVEHTAVVDAAIAATATETGLTEGSHCSVCGTVLVAQVVIPALGEQSGGNENQGGNNTNPATAVSESDASAVNIYTIGNSIVVENATMEIRVYNAMGGLVATSKDANAKIGINGSGVYIVKVGSVVKRVVVN